LNLLHGQAGFGMTYDSQGNHIHISGIPTHDFVGRKIALQFTGKKGTILKEIHIKGIEHREV
jgi:hypothetical protein